MIAKEQRIVAALEALLPCLSKFEDRRYWIGRQLDFFCRDKRTNPTAGPFGPYHKVFYAKYTGKIEAYQDYENGRWTVRSIITSNPKLVTREALIAAENLNRWTKLLNVAADLETALNAND